MEVFFFKLVTGEELLAKARRDVGFWELENPIRVGITPKGLAMAPYIPLLKEEKIKVSIEHVIFHGEVADEVYNAYNTKFGSGIVLANTNDLKVVGGEDEED